MKNGDKVICIKKGYWKPHVSGEVAYVFPQYKEVYLIDIVITDKGCPPYLVLKELDSRDSFLGKYFRKFVGHDLKNETTSELAQKAKKRSIERIEIVPEKEAV